MVKLKGFGFLLTKTKSIHICRVRGCNKLSPELQLQNRTLPYIDTYKYLGVRVDHSLSRRTHIKDLKACTKPSLNLLKMLTGIKWDADNVMVISLYLALIIPKLDYGSEAYDSA